MAVIMEGLYAEIHRQLDGYCIACFPSARDNHILVRIGPAHLRLVEPDEKPAAPIGPLRATNFQRHVNRPFTSESKSDRTVLRELGLHANHDSLLLPLKLRGDEEIDIQAFVVVEVD